MAARVELGTWVHELLAAYYLAVKAKMQGKRYTLSPMGEVANTHRHLLREKWDPLFDEEKEQLGIDLPDKAWAIFERYVKRYAEQDKRWRKIISVEQDPKVKVPWLPVPLTIKCDLIVLDDLGFVWVIDHKVVDSIPDEDSRALDTQGPRYILGVQELLRQKGVKPKGVGMIYDYIRSKLPSVPKTLKKGGLSKDKSIDTDFATYHAAVVEAGFDPADYGDVLDHIAQNSKPFFERWAVPKSEERLHQERLNMQAVVERHIEPKPFYPRTLDRMRCSWDCEFKELCLLELEGGDIEPLLKDKFEVRGGKQVAYS